MDQQPNTNPFTLAFDLTWAVEDEVVLVTVLSEQVLQPVEVLHQVPNVCVSEEISFKPLQEHQNERDKPHTEGHGVVEVVCSRVEVHHVRHAARRRAELVHVVAVRGLRKR
ncbi:unnamed protein product [Phytophthora lilii]|uniref:Unnamed protein product n=1 Tax=Phytophthora lilii TaxID=2077276 RepID=A0A9W6TEQ8_9STRA|nr:unnamed protein product [Phytophthora lilii]